MKLVPIFIVARNFETNFSHNNCHNMARIIVYVGPISVGSEYSIVFAQGDLGE